MIQTRAGLFIGMTAKFPHRLSDETRTLRATNGVSRFLAAREVCDPHGAIQSTWYRGLVL